MIPERITKERDPYVKAWAMIYFVAEELQGKKEANEDAKQIIEQIGKLRSRGKLSDTQLAVIQEMYTYNIFNSDPDF